MLTPVRAVAVTAVVISIGGTFGQGSRRHSNLSVPVLTVCEALNDLSQYNGEAVVLVGKLVSTDEGAWLSENCAQKIITEGYAWTNAVSLTYVIGKVEPPPKVPTGFRWDTAVLNAKLTEVRKTTKVEVLKQYNYSDKWFAIFGRFETRVPPQLYKGGDGQPRPAGFGHLGAAPAQLISDGGGGFHELKPH